MINVLKHFLKGSFLCFFCTDIINLYSENEEDAFKKAVLHIMDTEVVVKFDTREGDAKHFYNIEGSEEEAN